MRKAALFFLPMLILLFAASAAICSEDGGALYAQDSASQSGPEVGDKIPSFSLPDQNGRIQDFGSLAGPNGLLILFYRSADW